MSDTITIESTELLVSKKEVDGVTVPDTYTVIADGVDLGEVMKVSREWFVKATGADDYAEASHKTKKGALASLVPVSSEAEGEGEQVTPLSEDEAASMLEALLGGTTEGQDDAEGEGDEDDTPAVLLEGEDETEEKATKHPRTTCGICGRRVPAKKDGSIASHKGFKRDAARCTGTDDGIKYPGFATVREAVAAGKAA